MFKELGYIAAALGCAIPMSTAVAVEPAAIGIEEPGAIRQPRMGPLIGHAKIQHILMAQASQDDAQADDPWVDGSGDEESESSKRVRNKNKEGMCEPDFTTPFPESCD